MKTLVYNYNSLTLSNSFESIAARAGYLLTDRCILATMKTFSIAIIKKPKAVKRRQKIWMLENALQQGEYKDLLDQIKAIYRLENRLKHKTKKQLVSIMRADKILHDLFKERVDIMHDELLASGLMDLEKLEELNVFDFFVPGYETEYDGRMIPAVSQADFLQLKMDFEDMSAALFCLPNEFMDTEFQASINDLIRDNAAHNYYLESCFSLPNINLLSAPELKLLRKQLLPRGNAFRNACEEWIKRCYSNAEPGQRESCFRQLVIPAIDPLQSAIRDNELLRSRAGLKNFNVTIEVLLGEIPVNVLWHFYRYFKTIDDKQWQILQEQGLPACGSWPVMIAKLKNREDSIAESTEIVSEPISVKKSILVD